MNFFHVRRVQKHMATDFELVISTSAQRCVSAEQILSEAHDDIARLENELSEFIPTSAVARLNAAPINTRVTMTAAAIELLDRSEVLRQATDGAFDAAAKSDPRATQRFACDVETGTAWRLHPGAHLGFGAIGKGYALDCVRTLIEREGFRDYLLVAGGSSTLMSGYSAPSQPWRWAWSWSKDDAGNSLGLEFSHSSGQPMALGVSGTHEQGNHLRDPRTGLPVIGTKSSLIGYPRAAEADAFSTALFVAGWDRALQFFDGLVDKPAMAMIDAEGVPRWNGFFQRMWGAVAMVMLFISHVGRAEEDVDLSAMGMDDFTPYIFDRNQYWILLPALSLLLVLLHLKKRPEDKKPRNQQTLERVK